MDTTELQNEVKATEAHAHDHADHAHQNAEDAGEEPMIALTEKAAEKVREIQAAEKIEPSYGLRLKVIGGGCSGFTYDLFFDQQAEGDRTFSSNGVQLLCDVMSLQYLAGCSVDYVEGLQGAGFKFNNPNVKGSCGCGSSFSA